VTRSDDFAPARESRYNPRMGRDSDTRLDEVRELAARGDHGHALHGYRELCERDPYDPDLWLERADVAEAAGLDADAIEALLHVLDLYAETGMAEAIDVAERVLELDPAHVQARRFLEAYAPDRNSAPRILVRALDGALDVPGGDPDRVDARAAGSAVTSAVASGGADPVPEPIWDTVPMHVPAAASASVALPFLDSVPMPMPVSDSVAMPAPRPEDLSGPVAMPRIASMREMGRAEPTRGESLAGRESLADRDDDLATLGSGVGSRAAPLPRGGRHRAAAHMIAGLRSSPLLDVLDQNALDFALESGHVRQVRRGETVIRQGERGDSLFLVLEGSVDVERYHPVLGMIVRLSTLTAGAFFGEQSLVAGVARSATVRARRETTVLELGRDTVLSLARMNDQVLVTLMRFFRARLVGTVMATSPLFHPFSADERRAMVGRLRLRELPPQDIVLRQGTVGDGLYVVLIGTLVAFVGDERGRARRLGVLGPGDVFGEMSLIRDEPAMASIGTHTRSWILRLPKEDFHEVVAGHPEVLDQLAEIAAVRQARNRDVLDRED
jgi:CRP-like cAMP-binding protein